MPPNRDRNKLVNAQGRQKACSECAKGKRKCDLGQPVCVRCRKQKLECSYPPPPPAANAKKSAISLKDLPTSQHVAETMNPLVEFEHIDATTEPLDFDFSTLTSTVDPDLLELGLHTEATLPESWDMLYGLSTKEDRLALQRTYPHVEKTFSPAHLAPLAKSRLSWSIEQLKVTPRMVVETNSTPWQHSKLYEDEMPRPLQDAHAACALYISKNSVNGDFITRYISERVNDLMASAPPTRPIDILAHAHACMLFQIMLVFGDNMHLHNLAEPLIRHLGKLEISLSPLVSQQIDPTDPLPLYPSTASRAAWTAFIFRESLRRTFLCIHQLITMFYLLRGQMISCAAHLLDGNRVTVSALLWAAENAFEFAAKWNGGRHFLVKELNFAEVLDEARPEEVDAFGKMILIGLMGVDDVRGWFGSRDGVL